MSELWGPPSPLGPQAESKCRASCAASEEAVWVYYLNDFLPLKGRATSNVDATSVMSVMCFIFYQNKSGGGSYEAS